MLGHHAHLFWVCHWPLPLPWVIGPASPGERELWSASEICFSFWPLVLGIPACLLSYLTSLALSSALFLSKSLEADLSFSPGTHLQFAKNLHSHVISHRIPGPLAGWQCAESRGLGAGSSCERQLPGLQAWVYPTAHPPPDLLILWSQVKDPLWPREHYGRSAGTPWVSQEPHLSVSEPSTGLRDALCSSSETPLPSVSPFI